MNNAYTIEELFAGYCEIGISEQPSKPNPKLSLMHKIKMKKAFRLFDKNKVKLTAEKRSDITLAGIPAIEAGYRHISFHKFLNMTFIIILSLFLSVSTYSTTVHFMREEYEDHTELFALNTANTPETIEENYQITELPEGYICIEDMFATKCRRRFYKKDYKTLTFYQNVKSSYRGYYDNERFSLVETTVNGSPALYMDCTENGIVFGVIVWDNSDYIFEISGCFSKDEIIALAESVRIVE